MLVLKNPVRDENCSQPVLQRDLEPTDTAKCNGGEQIPNHRSTLYKNTSNKQEHIQLIS